MTDALGDRTTFMLDAESNIETVVQSPHVGPTITTSYVWDSLQRLRSYTDPNLNTTSFEYIPTGDLTSRLSTVTTPTGSWQFTWDTVAIPAQLLTITDENSNVATLTWDSFGKHRRTGFQDATGKLWTYTYENAQGS